MNITIYTPDQQGVGGFDGGKITEQKPIGFSGDGSEVKRIGPLFYWAWAKAKNAGYIDKHPHQGFEIITYVVNGKAEHGDSLGTKSTVGPGGIQVMKTGSGVYHEEGFVGPDFDGFQIWFEPYLNDAILRDPIYTQHDHHDFPILKDEGKTVKQVIGAGSPVELVADIQMWDIQLEAGEAYSHELDKNRSFAILVFEGKGEITTTTEEAYSFSHKDFIVVSADLADKINVKTDNQTRLIAIEVPTSVNYPVYPK